MGSIPLPALGLRPPQPQENPVDQVGRLMQLRQMMAEQPLRMQALQQQVALGQAQVQTAQQDLAARQALNDAYKSSVTQDPSGKVSFDPDKMQSTLMSGPAAYQMPGVMENLNKFAKSRVDLQNSVTDLQGKQQDMLGAAAAAVKAANYDPGVAHGLLDSLFSSPAMANAPQAQQIRSTIDNPQALKQWVDAQVAQSPKQQTMQNAQKVAEIRANASPDVQALNEFKAQGGTPLQYQQRKIDMQTQADINRQTNPQVMAAKERLARVEAAARQAVSQGDPNAAGQLLVNGDATLSELKARGATPDFIAKTLWSARQLSGGKYNAQQAEADFNIAKSPSNVAFFGSAKSMLDKGGTLDQLEAAGKNIPQGKIPALNSIDDWKNEALGSGPMAKYASIALGVADDYAKVMGGGQGSDTSRLQALNLIKKNLSPEGRAGAVEGIRGAVGSQVNSRIGKNKIMQRMYGDDSIQQSAPGGADQDLIRKFGGVEH